MKRKILFLTTLCQMCLAISANACTPDADPVPETPLDNTRKNVTIEDFEGITHRQWTATGNAFGNFPTLVPTATLSEWGNAGFEGNYIITSWLNGDAGTGTLTSPPFTVDRKYLNFLIAGGSNKVYLALLIDGSEVFHASGKQSRTMEWLSHDLSQYEGRQAQIRLVDNNTAAWGFIDADYFLLSDEPVGAASKQNIKIEKKFLNFPVSYNTQMEKISIYSEGKKTYTFDIKYSATPDYWTYLDCSQWMGETIELEIVANPLHTGAADIARQVAPMIYQSDTPREKAQFYTEPLRPHYHYTVARAWLTDVCGIFYYNGLWHLQYQRNPYGIDWANMSWGHAVSNNLVTWTEQDDLSIYPDTLGAVFAGYSCIDENNALSLQQSAGKTIVTLYTAAGEYYDLSAGKKHTQCLAYSADGGYTWQKYAGNPVLNEVEPYNRDPHIFYDSQRSQYVMALYLTGSTYGFYRSTDWVNWKEASRYTLDGEFECPDFYRIKIENTDEYKWILSGVHGNYQVGRWNGMTFTPETAVKDMDFGTMTYAGHTFANAPDDRHVQIWNTGFPWYGQTPFTNQMTFPREVKLHKRGSDYILSALPVEEINLLHKNEYTRNVLPVAHTIPTPAYHIQAQFTVSSPSGTLTMKSGAMQIQYNAATQKLAITGYGAAQEIDLAPVNNTIDIELLSDVGFMELFLNGGETVGTLYQPFDNLTSTNIQVSLSGGVALNTFKVWEMKNAFLETVEGGTTTIDNVPGNRSIVKTENYTLHGILLHTGDLRSLPQGVYLQKQTDDRGNIRTQKIINRK
jgi:fructan beta-fructosidase